MQAIQGVAAADDGATVVDHRSNYLDFFQTAPMFKDRRSAAGASSIRDNAKFRVRQSEDPPLTTITTLFYRITKFIVAAESITISAHLESLRITRRYRSYTPVCHTTSTSATVSPRPACRLPLLNNSTQSRAFHLSSTIRLSSARHKF